MSEAMVSVSLLCFQIFDIEHIFSNGLLVMI